MKEILNIMLEYIISYALVFLLYYLLFIRKKTKYNKNKVPVEYYYVISLYGLKEKDIDYKKFMYMTLFVNTFIIVTTYIIVFKLLDDNDVIGTISFFLLVIIVVCFCG